MSRISVREPSSRVFDWLDERLGIRTGIWPVISHPVPKDIDWSYVLGSMVLVALVVQVVTGVALAMVYVPSPNAAFQSIQFITEDSMLGKAVRGIHYWGAAAMVTLVFAHLSQVFLIGAYKYPREFTWVSGSILLLLTLALGFTGQLLRWDQGSYWGIVVAAAQAGQVPVIGDVLMQLIVAGWTVGPATLTRFYATHVFLLPAMLFMFLAVHLYLVVRLGVSEPPKEGEPVDPATYHEKYQRILHEQGIPFFPDSYWRDAFAGFVLVLVIIGMAIVLGPPDLHSIADPTFIVTYPRPDWYFLWFFALLALIPHEIETLVIVGLPALIGVVLIGLPFLANRGERSPRRRPWAVVSVVLMLVAFVALSYQGHRAPWSPILEATDEIPFPAAALEGLDENERFGAQVFQEQACQACHSLGGFGGSTGPPLDDVGRRLDREIITTTILRGRGNMPGYAGTIEPEHLEALVDFLETLDGDTAAE